jgi:hypothetical protein
MFDLVVLDDIVHDPFDQKLPSLAVAHHGFPRPSSTFQALSPAVLHRFIMDCNLSNVRRQFRIGVHILHACYTISMKLL